VEDLIAKGKVDRQEFEIAKAQRKSNNQVNLGYAFITFSHVDEAMAAIIMTGGNMFMDTN